ncbi:hypothetical protein [Clostridioides difficile]|nr:hypothetical protein [Clostridioides difficile]
MDTEEIINKVKSLKLQKGITLSGERTIFTTRTIRSNSERS